MHTKTNSCVKCRDIYESLRQHFFLEHTGDITGNGAILNNILLNVLALTASFQTSQDKDGLTLAASLDPVSKILSVGSQAAGKAFLDGASLRSLECLTVSEAAGIPAGLSTTSPVQSKALHAAQVDNDFREAVSKVPSPTPETVVIHKPRSSDHHGGFTLGGSHILISPSFDEVPKDLRVSSSAVADSLSIMNPGKASASNSSSVVDNSNLDLGQVNDLKAVNELSPSAYFQHLIPGGLSPLNMTQLLAADGTLTPAAISLLLANQNLKDFRNVSGGQASGKSDLDVADILVNKMPIPSLNKALDPSLLHLSTLYLRQLALSQQQQHLQQQQQHLDVHPSTQGHLFLSPSAQKPDLTMNLVDHGQQFLNKQTNDSTACQINEMSSMLSSVASKDFPSVASANDTMEQLIARHKQISNLIDFLTKKSKGAQACGSAGPSGGSVDGFNMSPRVVNISGVQSQRQGSTEHEAHDHMRYDDSERDARNCLIQTAPFVFGNLQLLNSLSAESNHQTSKSALHHQQGIQQTRQHSSRFVDTARPSPAEAAGNAASNQYLSITQTLQPNAQAVVSSALHTSPSISQKNPYLAPHIQPVTATAKHASSSTAAVGLGGLSNIIAHEKGLQQILTWASSYPAGDYDAAHPVLGNPADSLPTEGGVHVPIAIASLPGEKSTSAPDSSLSNARLYSILKPLCSSTEASLNVISASSSDATNAGRVAKSGASNHVGGAVDSSSDAKAMLISLQTLISRTISSPVLHASEEVSEVDMRKQSALHAGSDDDLKKHFSVASMVPLSQYVASTSKTEDEAEARALFQCKVCSITFGVLSTLHAHEKSHLGEQVQECNFCYETFRSSDEYEKHIAGHRGEESILRCSFCPKIFTSRGDFNKHVIEHTQRRPYCCSHCQKAFRDPGSLVKHERIHTGERPYKCDECQRAFAEYSSLRKHIRTHSGEKPYKCSSCNKAFSISGNLQRHMFIHTGQRPYKCTLCAKAFNNPSHLRRHIKNLHGEADAKAIVAAATTAARGSADIHDDDEEDAEDVDMPSAGEEGGLSDDVGENILHADKVATGAEHI